MSSDASDATSAPSVALGDRPPCTATAVADSYCSVTFRSRCASFSGRVGFSFRRGRAELGRLGPRAAGKCGRGRRLLTAIRAAAMRDGQHTTWANIELFRSWPLSCQRTPTHKCPGRHPAPMSRILSQIVAESPIVKAVGGNTVSWEWFTCLSPHGRYIHSHLEKAAAALTNYKEYELYVQNGTR